MFKMVDVNGDRAVSMQELEKRMAKFPERSRREWEGMMAEMDKDGSGEIDFPEFDAVVRILTDVSDPISDAEFGFNWITPA